MRLESFRARDLGAVARSAEALFGDEAVVLHTRTVRDGTEQVVEVVAASASDVDAFRTQLTPAHLPNPTARRGNRPYVVALVGPTGAGKTTTIAKLAANLHAFGTWRVGMITLDTFRVAGLEQIATYAEITGCPLEVAYDAADAARAVAQLTAVDVILVDTPGRGPRSQGDAGTWRAALRQLRPDEVHLCMPASWRLDLATSARESFAPLGITHALVTKLDEVPADAMIARLAAAIELPARWVTDGQDIPTDLRDAAPRMLGALGVAPAQVASA